MNTCWPGVHFMCLKAQVGVQDEAGCKIIILTQLLGTHSWGGHVAPLSLQTGSIKPWTYQTQTWRCVKLMCRNLFFKKPLHGLHSLREHRLFRGCALLCRRDIRWECWERVWLWFAVCSLVNLFLCRLPFNTMFLDSPSHFMPTSPLVQLHLVSELMEKLTWGRLQPEVWYLEVQWKKSNN